jgi:hypothetical protein
MIATGLKPIKDLPNLEGFEFVAVDKDGREFVARVGKMEATGTFYVVGVTAFNELIGWEHRPK